MWQLSLYLGSYQNGDSDLIPLNLDMTCGSARVKLFHLGLMVKKLDIHSRSALLFLQY